MSEAIEGLLSESRTSPPPPEFAAAARISDGAIRAEAEADPEGFWAGQAAELLDWSSPWDQVCDWQPPFARWFLGGTLNVAYNCVDRHLADRAQRTAIIWEGDDPSVSRHITYAELHEHVCRFANVLQSLGIQKGDRATIYMGMVPELAIAMLACARVGAIHTVVFGGFSPESLKDRINDCKAKLVITADGGWRRGKVIELKANVDKALEGTPSVQSVIVVKRCPLRTDSGRSLSYQSFITGL